MTSLTMMTTRTSWAEMTMGVADNTATPATTNMKEVKNHGNPYDSQPVG